MPGDAWLLATFWILASFLIAAVAVRASIGYAQRAGMVDQPGRRRSHRLPTPRGGGIGVVLALLVCLPGALLSLPAPLPLDEVLATVAGLALIAAVGVWDDRRSLPALPRLLVQLLSTALVGATLIAHGLHWAWLLLIMLAGTWCINLHNFMDGIDGLLAQQAIFVFVALAWLAAGARQPALACASACIALASAGFWLYNRPPARIFMGDAGSTGLGFLFFVVAIMLWRGDSQLLWPSLILSCGFTVDASLTLICRIAGGRRWSSPHREHLYQWLVRTGLSHGRVGLWYLVYNLLVLAPLAWVAWRFQSQGWLVCLVAVAITMLLWRQVKRSRVRIARTGAPDVAA